MPSFVLNKSAVDDKDGRHSPFWNPFRPGPYYCEGAETASESRVTTAVVDIARGGATADGVERRHYDCHHHVGGCGVDAALHPNHHSLDRTARGVWGFRHHVRLPVPGDDSGAWAWIILLPRLFRPCVDDTVRRRPIGGAPLGPNGNRSCVTCCLDWERVPGQL